MNAIIVMATVLNLAGASSENAALADKIELSGKAVVGQPVTLTLRLKEAPAQGIELKAAYRENAHKALQHQQTIGRSAFDGTLRWVPEEAGVVVLSWEGGTKNISVFYDGVPISGVLVALLAGFLLLGGTIFFFIQMMRSKED